MRMARERDGLVEFEALLTIWVGDKQLIAGALLISLYEVIFCKN